MTQGRTSPPISRLLRAGTAVVVLALLSSALIAALTVLSTNRDTDVLIGRLGPLRTDNALLLRNLVDAETGLRGYQITATLDVLQPYRTAEQAIPRLLSTMRSRARDNDRWRARIDEQAELINHWFSTHAGPVILGLQAGEPATVTEEVVEQGRDIVDEVRDLNARFDAELLLDRADLRSNVDDTVQRAVIAIALTLVLTLAALSWRTRRVRLTISEPIRELVHAVDGLDVGAGTLQVDVRGAVEVERLAETLEDLARRTATLTAANADRLQEERLVRHLTRRVREALGRRDVLERAAAVLGSVARADHVLVFGVTDGKVGETLVDWGQPGTEPLGVDRLPDLPQVEDAFAAIVAAREVLVINDLGGVTPLPEPARRALTALGAGAAVLAPAVSVDGAVALIVVLSSRVDQPWSPLAATAASAVADDLATALTHARLFEREQDMVERLRELDKAKNDFVSSVSHELRTPLTSIRGYVELLRDGEAGELDPEQDHMLGIVERNSERLLALIEDLLTLSRVESGAFRSTQVSVALDAVVRSTVDALGPQAATAGVEIALDVAPGVPTVRGDPTQLERVLLNLLSNAIKFSDSGGHVEVVLGTADEQVTLEVRDHGIGIPAAEQGELFSRFFRSSSAQERAIPGTGLGLVIVQSIVEHHGGTIGVTSSPGVGTTVHITLPVEPAMVAS